MIPKYLFIVNLVIITFVVSCSTSTTKSDNEFSSDIEAEFKNIENSVFEKTIQVKYDESSDYYKQPKAIQASAVLDETLDLNKDKKVYEVIAEQSPINQGIALCYSGNVSNGIKTLQKEARYNQKNPTYYLALGNCFFLDSKLRMALLYYNEARSLSPDFAPAINNIGVISELNGLHQNALAAYVSSSKARPLSSTPVLNQAQLLLRYNLSKSALLLLEKIYETDGDKIEVILALANCYLMEGRAGEASNLFEKAKDNYKIPASQLLNYAYALALLHKTAEASEVLQEVSSASGSYDVSFLASLKKEYSL